MQGERKVPSGEKILSLLVDLLADQYGVKVKYSITERKDDEKKRKCS